MIFALPPAIVKPAAEAAAVVEAPAEVSDLYEVDVADREWAAANLNADADGYFVEDEDFDFLADMASASARMEAGCWL